MCAILSGFLVVSNGGRQVIGYIFVERFKLLVIVLPANEESNAGQQFVRTLECVLVSIWF